jgi:hypothetical protein
MGPACQSALEIMSQTEDAQATDAWDPLVSPRV